MENTELKEKYCREFGYSYFNKHNENEYTKWLESKLLEALKPVKNNGVLDDVSDSVCTNCDGYGYTIDENGRRKEHCDKC